MKLTNEQISNLLCSAFEGGSNYWYFIEEAVCPTSWEYASEPTDTHWLQDYPLNPGGYLMISHGEPKFVKLDKEAIEYGVKVMEEKYLWHFGNILQENDDAETGDVFLQCCLFGEIIYG